MIQNDARRKIQELVTKYEQVRASGKLNKYSEQDTKDSFIRPMFEALGWDFDDRDEVSKEEFVNTAGRVDYGIYLNNQPKLFIEAKKLGADIHKQEFAEQAIRYCFNRVVTWAVLTDFETLKVFNAQNTTGSLSDKLYFEIPYTHYLERFDQIWQLSKESFESGFIDQEAMRVGKLQQKITVTEQLAKDLNIIREMLTNKISEWNPQLRPDDIDEGVQKLIDRLIFLRVAEDKGIEEHILKQLLVTYNSRKDNSVPIYQMMVSKFRELDEIYNSGLFSPHPFEKWEEYSGVTEKSINILYGKSGYYEYDFKLIPSDVLGQVYENYLGHLLSKSRKGLTLDVSAKKRKEQGIYYTPSYIEDYIVEQALKPILDRCNSVTELKEIKVLDPACGSGSFLIKALDIIEKKYVEFGARKGEGIRLQILLDNIYGVDLDEKAVEIARLNLVINSLESRMKLPGLENHIKNGNSLISGNDEELKSKFGKNYLDVKAFNWQKEFPEVFKRENPGFDVIIGNPPYIKEFVNKSAFDGLRDSSYYQGKMDLWTFFLCQGIDHLRDGGLISYIAPNNWVTNAGASITREKVLKESEIIDFVDFGGYQVFENAGIQTMIVTLHKVKPRSNYGMNYLNIGSQKNNENDVIKLLSNDKCKIQFSPESMTSIIEFSSSQNNNVGMLLYKIAKKKNFALSNDEVAQGIVGAPDECFLLDSTSDYSDSEKQYIKKYYTSSKRYQSAISNNYIIYLSDKNFRDQNLSNFPSLAKHFSKYEKVLREAKKKYETPNKPYYYLHREREEKFFSKDAKIIAAIRTSRPAFYFTTDEYYGSRALNFIKTNRVDLRYLTGILNSKIIAFWLNYKGKKLGNLLQIDKGPLLAIPLYVGSKNDQRELSKKVSKIQKLYVEQAKATENSNKWHEIASEIERVDRQIDQLVYQLYGLTEDEVKILEGKNE